MFKKFLMGLGGFILARFVIGFIVGFIVGLLNANGASIDISTWPVWLFIFIG